MTVGAVAGDEESYEVFADLLDPIIEGRHNGFGKDAKHKTDLNPDNLKGGVFDEKYVLSSRVRTGRSIKGIALPPHCTRGERRAVEKIAVDALAGLEGDIKGVFKRFCEGLTKIETLMKERGHSYMWNEHL